MLSTRPPLGHIPCEVVTSLSDEDAGGFYREKTDGDPVSFTHEQ